MLGGDAGDAGNVGGYFAVPFGEGAAAAGDAGVQGAAHPVVGTGAQFFGRGGQVVHQAVVVGVGRRQVGGGELRQAGWSGGNEGEPVGAAGAGGDVVVGQPAATAGVLMQVVGGFDQPAGGVSLAAIGGGRPAQGDPVGGGDGGEEVVAFQGGFAAAFRGVVGQPGVGGGAGRELPLYHAYHIDGVVAGAGDAGRRADIDAGAHGLTARRDGGLQTFAYGFLEGVEVIVGIPLFQFGEAGNQVVNELAVAVGFAVPEPAVGGEYFLNMVGGRCPIQAGAAQGVEAAGEGGYEGMEVVAVLL